MSRLIFAGTPVTAVPALRRLVADGHEIVAVLTRPDAPLGRKRVLTPSPVAQVAQELGLALIKSSKIDDATHTALVSAGADLAVVVAYGGLIPRRTLDGVPHGWVNLHFSLLPELRGAAPVQHALIRCADITGASVFVLEEGLDTGPVLGMMTEAVRDKDTTGTLLDRLAHAGSELLSQAVAGYVSGQVVPIPQTGEPTLAPKLGREDGRVDWTQPARAVRGRIAGTTPEPGAFTEISEAVLKLARVEEEPLVDHLSPGTVWVEPGKNGRVLVGTGSHAVALTEVQPAGKKMMRAADWARGLQSEDKVLLG
ncbi:methionyl-tRNA formyltransferase [Galactobacter caseinivorans]|uniref:Methionyl-tRNA formyltransferase n=1 Tax=Galactobacter caseinivorans TaxID=2676123 RepID=A0A496PKK4_9MICC|nr:methionyl-tRNA formyltransferase [Galactobacter caseinivorans]RKW71018.1 methionyl-tRNA formyltransferase [Galactobacter caseinivorans]